jgi:hypothetical protein
MMHINDDQLILYHYREADEADAIEAHLKDCEQCRTEYERLQKVLGAVDAAPIPERSEDYGKQVWAKIEPQITQKPEAERVPLFTTRRVVWAAAIAASLILAFFLGRYTPHKEAPIAETDDQGSPQRVLLVAVGDHLERAQMMLIELVNAEGNGTIDISSEQKRAGDLVDDNRLFRQAALRDGDPVIASVLDELERYLVEIANSPSQIPSDEFETIRRDIENEGLLFKVRVVRSQVRRQERQAAPDSTLPAV